MKKSNYVKAGSIAVCYLKLGQNAPQVLQNNKRVAIHSENPASKNKGALEMVSPLDELEEDCYQRLQETVQELAEEAQINWNALISAAMIRQMSTDMPTTEGELENIDGMTGPKLTLVSGRLLPILKEFTKKRKELLDHAEYGPSTSKKSTISAAKKVVNKLDVPKPLKRHGLRLLTPSDSEDENALSESNGSIVCIDDDESTNGDGFEVKLK